MRNRIFKNKKQFILISFVLLLFVLIRAYEKCVFYDPFLSFFEGEFAHAKLPNVNKVKLFLSLGFRYYLNSILSILLLWIVFKDASVSKVSVFVYSIVGMLLMISFFFVLEFFAYEHKMVLFYIRRFIIHPILLLVLLPAFFYQKKVKVLETNNN